MSSELKHIIKIVTVYKIKVSNIREVKTINGILSYNQPMEPSHRKFIAHFIIITMVTTML